MKSHILVRGLTVFLALAWFLHGVGVVSAEKKLLTSPDAIVSPLDRGYTVASEDEITISVWRDESLTRDLVVRPDGKVSFPLIGDLIAEGKTVDELQKEVMERLARYLPNPSVWVSVKKINSYKIYVIGKVTKPGEYLVGHYTDVMQALSLAGGLTTFASPGQIQVLRRKSGTQSLQQFSYSDVFKGELAQNIILERGDVVMVP
jgi:polysaccharide export outer membrane protein